MTNFTENIIVIVNTVLLTVVYFFGVGLTKLLGMIANKRFLDIRVSKKTKTYWSDLNLGKKEINEYYRQF